MKTYKKQWWTSPSGINCAFYMNVDDIKTARYFYECNYKNNYQYDSAIFNFETELIGAGYVKEGDTIDYE